MMTVLHLAAAALLLTMAGIQLNDPDPLFWVVLYVAAAVVPIARLIRRRLPVFWGVAFGLALAGLVASLPGFIDFVRSGDYTLIGGQMTADRPQIESAREFLGAVIGLSCLLPYRGWHTRKPGHDAG
ncbi:MAG: transmembrane 220 family protein [Planctomycetota bacterium]